ncbi:MAG: DUF4340 domain-containing protein [Oscillospiraceae bacterium]
MAKLSKTTKTVIIAAAVLLVLGIVLLVLMLTSPSGEETTSSGASDSTSTSSSSADEIISDLIGTEESAQDDRLSITNKEQENVLKLEITNETGSFSFDRNSRQVSSTDEDGNVSTTTEFYWGSPELSGITHNDSTIGAMVRSLAGLSAKDIVEENASDLEKYGLMTPVSSVKVTFDDGTETDMCFGIRNPAASNYVYFCEKGSNDVMQVSYYSTGSVFYDVKDFVSLVLTTSYDGNNPQELDYLIIERKDLSEPVEIEYMYDVAAEAENEDSVITTFNSHRITSPITAELDTTSGQTICYGLYGLSAASCKYIDPTDEEIAETGLSDPYCRISFKYGGKARVLLLGNEIRSVEDSEDGSGLSTVTGYYAMFEGDRQIWAISTNNAPWYTFKVQDIMSRRPISPYIYTVDTLTVTTPDGEYKFRVDGDSDNHTFYCGEQVLDDSSFKGFYQHLITSMGEELYFEDADYEPYIKVHFTYRSEYESTYGRLEDVIEFYKSDDRKNIVRVNGDVLYKVRQVYTERLLSNLDALLNGGDIELNW